MASLTIAPEWATRPAASLKSDSAAFPAMLTTDTLTAVLSNPSAVPPRRASRVSVCPFAMLSVRYHKRGRRVNGIFRPASGC